MDKNRLSFSELVRITPSHGCWFCALLLFFIPLNAIDYTVPYYPWKIDTCDINDDGSNDLIVLTSEGLCALFNNGDGTFAPYELIIPGIVDIVACCQLDNIAGDDIVVLRCLGDSAGTPIQYECYYNGNFYDPIIIPFSGNYKPHHSFKYAHGDFNNDGFQDIVLTGFVEISTNRIFGCYMYNLGNGQFSVPTYTQCVYSAYSDLAVGDFNEDNLDDVAFTISSIQIYYSTGTGFYNYEALPASHCGGILAIDFDQDGDIDLVTNAWEGGSINHHYYLENVPGNGFVVHESYYEHYMVTLSSADLNNDSYPDIVCTPGGSTFGVYINLHNWTMEQHIVSFPFYGEHHQKSCLALFDDDPFCDIAIARDTAPENNLTILYNDGTGNFFQTPVSIHDEVIPSITNRIQCYPNPSQQGFDISYDIPNKQGVSRLTIYNLRGQKILQTEVCGSGVFHWNGRDARQNKLPSGVYLIKVDTLHGQSTTTKLTLK